LKSESPSGLHSTFGTTGIPRRVKHVHSSLQHLASIDEPLNSEAVVWSQKVFGNPFLDTYWQTETGCIVISNYPGMEVRPGSIGKPFPGITSTVLEPSRGEPYPGPGKIGLVALKFGWRSRIRTYWNKEEAFRRISGTTGISSVKSSPRWPCLWKSSLSIPCPRLAAGRSCAASSAPRKRARRSATPQCWKMTEIDKENALWTA